MNLGAHRTAFLLIAAAAAGAPDATASILVLPALDGSNVPDFWQPVLVRPWPGAGPDGEDLVTVAVAPTFEELGGEAAFLVALPAAPAAALLPAETFDDLRATLVIPFLDPAEPGVVLGEDPPTSPAGGHDFGCGSHRRNLPVPSPGGSPAELPSPSLVSTLCGLAAPDLPAATAKSPDLSLPLVAGEESELGPYRLRLFPPGAGADLAEWLEDADLAPQERKAIDRLEGWLDAEPWIVAARYAESRSFPGPRSLPPLALTVLAADDGSALVAAQAFGPDGGGLGLDLFVLSDSPWRIPGRPIDRAGEPDRSRPAVADLVDEGGVLVRHVLWPPAGPGPFFSPVVPDPGLLLPELVFCVEPPPPPPPKPKKPKKPKGPPQHGCPPAKSPEKPPVETGTWLPEISCFPVGVPDFGDLGPDCRTNGDGGGYGGGFGGGLGDLVPDCRSDGDGGGFGGGFGGGLGDLVPDCAPSVPLLPGFGGFVPGCAGGTTGPFVAQLLAALWIGRRFAGGRRRRRRDEPAGSGDRDDDDAV